MSLKKTWFSYVLWFVFTVLTVLMTYSVLTEVLKDFYSVFNIYTPAFAWYLDIAAKIVTALIVVGAVILIHYFCGKVKIPEIPWWAGITFQVLTGIGIVAGFCLLRYQAFTHAYFLQAYSSAPSAQMQCFYELSKIGAASGNGFDIGFVFVLEQSYTYVIRTIFLFFGNKIEFLLYFQLFLQSASLILLMVIGWTLQKGIFAWIPALLYAVMPTFFYTAEDVGITNFWMFVVIFGLTIICLLEKAWKKKNITYLVLVFVQLVFGGFVFFAKMDVLLYGKVPFISGGTTSGVISVLDIEMLILCVFLLAYCVSFFFDKQDHRSLFVLPFAVFLFLSVWISNYEYEASYCMMLLAMLNFFFMVSQSVRMIFRVKPEVVTGQNKATEVNRESEKDKPKKEESELRPTEFEWADMKEVMHDTEGIVVSVSKSEKVDLPVEEVIMDGSATNTEVVIDRTAPIENVLPMPKKHKPRVLDYAFEPAEDMMHYDVEIENDEYDY